MCTASRTAAAPSHGWRKAGPADPDALAAKTTARASEYRCAEVSSPFGTAVNEDHWPDRPGRIELGAADRAEGRWLPPKATLMASAASPRGTRGTRGSVATGTNTRTQVKVATRKYLDHAHAPPAIRTELPSPAWVSAAKTATLVIARLRTQVPMVAAFIVTLSLGRSRCGERRRGAAGLSGAVPRRR